jgi:membrane-associated phospholipid phosphatase
VSHVDRSVRSSISRNEPTKKNNRPQPFGLAASSPRPEILRTTPRSILGLLILGVLTGTSSAAAQASEPSHRLKWRADWRPFEWVDGVQTGLTTAAFLYVQFGIDPPSQPRWTGPILFDGQVRDALVADSRDGRNRAAVISDITWYVPMLLPFVESALVPLAFDDGNWEIAWELTAMNLQAASVTALLTRLGHRVILRARPDTEPCNEDPDYDRTCGGGSNASFPGGHGSAALLGAGLVCAHHSQLPLYGGGAPDVAVCVAASTMGMVSSVARLSADRHYASDAIVGALIGIGAGFGMPVLLHYHGVGSFDEQSSELALRWTLVPMTAGDALGLGVYGWF